MIALVPREGPAAGVAATYRVTIHTRGLVHMRVAGPTRMEADAFAAGVIGSYGAEIEDGTTQIRLYHGRYRLW